jgi:hypothetical protein
MSDAKSLTKAASAKNKSTKAAPVKNAKNARKEVYDKKRVIALLGNLKEITGRAEGLMKDLKDGKIEVDGHLMLLRGLSQVDNFLNNSSKALSQANRKATTL